MYQILENFNPFNPILEGRAVLTLFGPPSLSSNRFQPSSEISLPEDIKLDWLQNFDTFYPIMPFLYIGHF